MKQKGKRAGRRLASLLLAFAMVVGMLSGPVFVKQTAQAAGEGTIELGELKNNGTYYTYPDAKVKMTDESKYFYDLSVTVDSGYFKIPQSKMLQETSKAMGILSDGSIAGNYMGSDDKFVEVSIDNEYASIVFSWDKNKHITKNLIEDFIKRIQFVTSASKSQVVSICATTLNDDEKVAKVNGYDIYLKYFNGHFYGYSGWGTPQLTWNEASKTCKEAEFGGVKGYLATITSRAEDRFIFTNFYNAAGWLGCTRAKLAEGSNYDDPDPKWQDVVRMADDKSNLQTDFVWKWVTGPETGMEFGYQTQSQGWDPMQKENTTGGFQVYDGCFANWGTMEDGDGFAEPNGGGGVFPTEGFGYYGQYNQGRWNDHPIDSTKIYYIEFGGYPGDEQKFKDNLGDVIYTVTKDSADNGESGGIIDDGSENRNPLNKGLVEIMNKDPYGHCIAGSPIQADIQDILNENPDWNLTDADFTYQWYVQENEGVEKPITDVISGADGKIYRLTEEDFGKKLSVWVTVTKDDGEGNKETYSVESNQLPIVKTEDSDPSTVVIGGIVSIEKTGEDDNKDPILTANVDQVTPEGVQPVLDYQWYIYDPETPEGENSYTEIEGATDQTYTVPEENQGKQLVVKVTPNAVMKDEGYEGEVASTPYEVVKKDVLKEKEPISGVVKIENKTLDDDGEPINKAGSILSADITGIIPADAQKTDLNYQWYVIDENNIPQLIPGATDPNYVLRDGDIDRQVYVKVSADEEHSNYTGSVTSSPYDTTRTNADISIEPDPSPDPNIDPNGEKRIIKITPTADSTGYTVWEFISQMPPENLIVTDKDGNVITDQADDEGYYFLGEDKEIWFYVDKDGTYDIKERQIIHSNTETLGTKIEDKDTKVDYEPTTDTITITVDPAKTDYQYAILKKVDGVEKAIIISRNSDGTYSPDSNQDQADGKKWSDGEQDVVTFKDLPADGTYRIVAIPCVLPDGDDRDPDKIDPSGVLGGSSDIDATKYPTDSTPINDPKTNYDPTTDTITIAVDPAKTDYQYAILKKVNGEYQKVTVSVDANGNYVYDEKGTNVWSNGNQGVVTFTKLPADGTYRIVAVPMTTAANKPVDPSQMTTGGSKDIDGSKIKQDATAGQNQNQNQNQNPGTQYTQEEEDKAEKFIKDYVTDTKKKLITKVDDSTRDIIISGESTWNKMTDREKAAVNAKLKERGCPYTYEQLLAMAKDWKIPSFDMKKVMKKGTKSKIKMVKCSGATIVTTTSNKKVGTISKKGVIKAKKVGKAKLTITAIKGKYTNRLVIRLVVRKKFKNAKEIKKLKANQIKTPTLLLNKRRKVGKSTKVGIVDLKKKSKVKYKSFNTKNFSINKKGRYKAKRLGSSLIRTTVKQNGKTYILYLYLTGTKK